MALWGSVCALLSLTASAAYTDLGSGCCGDDADAMTSHYVKYVGGGAECEAQCTGDAQCEAFSFGATYKECTIYGVAITTAPTGWFLNYQAGTVCGGTCTGGTPTKGIPEGLGAAQSSCMKKQATAAAASVSGDPVTFFNGIEHKFGMPIGIPITLLKTKDLTIRAVAFQGEAADEQWIERFIVYSAAGARVVDVHIRRDIANFRRHGRIPTSYETIRVNAPWLNETLLTPPTDDDAASLFHWGSFTLTGHFDHPHNISFNILRIRNHPSMREGAPRREGVLVECDSVKLFIVSTSALEYYWADPDDQRARQFSHLDFELWDMKEVSSFGGLLPEVWGLKPGTDATHHDEESSESARGLTTLILTNMLQAESLNDH